MRLRRKDAVAGLGGLNGVGHLVGDDDKAECANVETREEIEEHDTSQDMSELAKGMGGAAYEGS
jgi:hypothetical protein